MCKCIECKEEANDYYTLDSGEKVCTDCGLSGYSFCDECDTYLRTDNCSLIEDNDGCIVVVCSECEKNI